jgi:hypothetical protein
MMMIIARDLIGQVTGAGMRWTCQPVPRQEFQRAIDGWFRQPRKILLGFSKDLSRGKMRPGMVEHMQDRHPLGCHSESA